MILAGLLLQQTWTTWREVETVPYSEFQTLLKDHKFADVTVADQYIRGTLKEPQKDGRKVIMAVRVRGDIARQLDESGVPYSGVAESGWAGTLLGWIIPGLLMFWLWRSMLGRMGGRGGLGGLMSIGQSKAKVFVEKDIKVGFDDVAGVDEAKDELREVVAFLKDPAKYGRLGAHAPKGILLAGPPGTGKTLLARAVAGEAGVPFFSMNGSEFVELFVGVGAARVRDLFEQARANAPCIIFIDELDALGRARALVGIAGANDEKEQTLNQLLSELDGFDPSVGVVLLAATNRPEILDPALLRAGRFDRQIVVDRPDKRGREEILQVHLRKVKAAPDLDITKVAGLTPGFTGADLANLVNEAAMLATRRGGDAVNGDDFVQAIERIVAGPEKRNRVIKQEERRIVAYHEMGHALVSLRLPGVEEVKKITILPRTVGALGYTLQMPTEDRYLMRRSELEAKMATLLGGRAAEALVFGDVSTGASDDLQKATEIARAMAAQYGMEPSLGEAVFEAPPSRFLPGQPGGGEVPISEATAATRDAAIIRLVGKAEERARAILTADRAILDRWAALLLDHETLGEADIAELKAELARAEAERGPRAVAGGYKA
ncbi:cell division protein FtsH [Alsobacter soli]|uniref:ATP-dependent zinc metalloprotease FtsH n=2 Tax=Alsobacter soli TaxID=2109933 RepID=A0A2T1HYN6_9HYPH|nr:ATP-dependent zinc metalloprotease FtsH [Alsobacter soli]PSC06807.1 cell division protein FtsH [Alsobacter soli]